MSNNTVKKPRFSDKLSNYLINDQKNISMKLLMSH